MYRPILLIPLLVLALANSASAQNNWAAAACSGLGPKCTRYIAKASGHCFPRLYMSSQPPMCRKAACEYCRRYNRRANQLACKRESIIKNCFGGRRVASKPKKPVKNKTKKKTPSKPKPKKKTPSKSKPKKKAPGKPKPKKKAPSKPKPKKKAPSKPKKKTPSKPKPKKKTGGKGNNKPKPKGKGKPGKNKPTGGKGRGGFCKVFIGSNNKVVIPTSRLRLNSAWSRNSDGSMTWKRKGGSGIDRAGSGTICARFKVPSSGTYYMTVISKAPHPTEYNDAWFKFNAGFRLFRPPRSWKRGGSGWFKGYQNDGRNRKANYILTIDFNGHEFISNRLTRGREYQICVSGRSAMYTIYQLIFIKCEGAFGCNRFNNPIKKAMRFLPPSRC